MARFKNLLLGAFAIGTMSIFPTLAQAQNDVVLRAVSFFGQGVNFSHAKELADRVNAADIGVRIDLLGGPEVIAYPDQMNALRSGVIDIVFVSGSQIYNQFPISDYLDFTNINPVERRELGIQDVLQEYYHQRMNAHSLGYYLWDVQGVLYFGRLDASREAQIRAGDFAGFRLRGAATYAALYGALGIESFPIAVGDIYTALERGTIDGYAFVNIDVVSQGWDEVTDYRIDVPFSRGFGGPFVNLDKWNSLTDQQRADLERVAEEWEIWSLEAGAEAVAAEKQKQIEAGIEMIEPDEETRNRILEGAAKGSWESLREKLPDLYAKVAPLEKEDRGTYIPPVE